MTLLDELAAANTGRVGGRCKIASLHDTLDGDTSSELRAALADRTIPATVIADVLKRRGHDLSEFSVQRHRRQGRAGGCRCEAL